MPQVAIVHGLGDYRLGNALRRHLEEGGIPCWFAARDLKANEGTLLGHEGVLRQAAIVVAVVPGPGCAPEPLVDEALEAARHGAAIIPVGADLDPEGTDGAFGAALWRVRSAVAGLSAESPQIIPPPPSMTRRRLGGGARGARRVVVPAAIALTLGAAAIAILWRGPEVGASPASSASAAATTVAIPKGGLPMRISGAHNLDTWRMVVELRERASRIDYRLDGRGDWTSTGPASTRTDLDGNPADALIYFELPEMTRPVTFEIRYLDLHGVTKGPFSQLFDPSAEIVRETREELETTHAEWASVRLFNDHRILYFHLLSQKAGIRTIRYGIDRADADQNLFFKPDLQGRNFNEDTSYLHLKPANKTLVMEVLLKDGSVLRKSFSLTKIKD